jgi:hypothetical protein
MIERPERASRKKDWVNREMARNGCFDDASAQARAPASQPAGYRTVCVRSCDGYFFPLGFSQSKAEFPRDRETCKGIYGEAPAELYVYPTEGTPEQMVSVVGDAYGKQSFAFAYRRDFSSACQAQLQRGTQRMRDAFAMARAREAFRSFKSIPVPVPRPSTEKTDTVRSESAPPPKVASRIILPFSIYASAAAETSNSEPKSSGAIGALLDLIAPPVKADTMH